VKEKKNLHGHFKQQKLFNLNCKFQEEGRLREVERRRREAET
jgi:hypothetical protein